MSPVSSFLWTYAVGVKVLLSQLLSRSFSLPVFPLQNGKVAIVTGGAKGIGYETAKHLSRLGMHVIIAGNHENQGELSVSRIVKETGNEKVEFMYLELASMQSIQQFVQHFKAKNLLLHVLVNNAAVMLVPQRNTADGFEEHFGVNYLGHFMLTHLLLDTLKQSGSHDLNSRIVTVSSATHYIGELNLNDLQSRHNYSPHGAYAQSKLALVLFSYQLQQRLAAEGSHVTSNVVDPGVVNTDLYKHTSWLFKLCKWLTSWLLFKTSTQGASTVIYAAVSPDLEGAGGSYYVNGQKVKSADISYDEDLQRKLWAQSCNLVGNPERHQCAS
ncbi:dehydrogenase/reductase SDR family member on chromosome X isoform X3 [Carcharodon carcharias]|uniref:dehydrogenase/reductase SDR family member on chromosome X isoform X3 n=1 Tax=Carcharodon carcharias TaxID=13397 RepID=UPI001B7F5F79|nr:dehydrogenase/reductase SDR family member on chromosome X isoform X3 [Carcharodon carcharias]